MDQEVQVGRYKVQGVIGRGAMGVVYLAFDPKIGRRVALKTVKPADGATAAEIAEGRARFLREAQAAGKLLHPNIVTVFDVIEEDGVFFIAMEYVEGLLLDRYCVKGELLPLERVVNLVGQGLSALAYAHKHGIVHRDIKPGNLMVVDGQTLKVMDFGVAWQPGASLTQSGMVVGTPHYMSPEQIDGKPLDGRTDLFSMGVVLYELLTGERPFPGEVISTVAYRVVNEAPVPPHELNPKVPEALSRIVLKALAKKPEERYLSAQAFKDALGHYAHKDWDLPAFSELDPRTPHHEGFLPPPPSTGLKRTKTKHHHLSKGAKWFIGIGVFAVVLLFAAGTIYVKEKGLDKGRIFNPPPSQEELPKPVNVVTDPPGAKLYLDGIPVDVITIGPKDQKEHLVEARMGCLVASTRIPGATPPSELKMRLAPGVFKMPVTSIPSGAKVIVDGKETGLVTPAQLERNGCGPFTLTLALKGWQTMEMEVDPRKSVAVKVALVNEPDVGSLRVDGGSAKMQIFEEGRQIGAPGQVIELSAGEHDLRFVVPSIRGTKQVKVEIKPGERQVLKAPAFETGQVFLYGKPANEGKVFVDGAFLEELPLNGTTPLAVGPHQFQVVGPNKRKVNFNWDVRRGEQTRVVDFSTGRVENH